MKNLIIVLLAIVALSSCKKEEIGQYHRESENVYNEPHDNTTYVYGGTLPNSVYVNDEYIIEGNR